MRRALVDEADPQQRGHEDVLLDVQLDGRRRQQRLQVDAHHLRRLDVHRAYEQEFELV